MKFLIFTCLVAVALAKHVVKDQSSEDSARSYSEKYKQSNDVYFQTTQDSASSSSSEESDEEVNSQKIVQTEAQKFNLNEQKKIKQFSQNIFCSQFCRPASQQQTDMNQWSQSKNIHSIPNQESISIIVKEILEKIIDMIKNNQIQQFNIPQLPQAVHPQQMPVNYWDSTKRYNNPYAPYVV